MLEFVDRAAANSFKPISSETSLLRLIFKLSIPLLCARCFANSTNPVSEKLFLLISKTFIVQFYSRKPLRVERPVLFILFVLRDSSSKVLFSIKATTNSAIPPSLIKFWDKLSL